MKNQVKSFIVCVMLATSCVTGPDGKRQVDADRVSRIAGHAAAIGSAAYLTAHPEQRPAFIVAEQALTGLIEQENYDPVAFSTALQALPTDALRGKEGALYVSVAVVVWDEAIAAATKLDQETLVRKTMIAVRDGLRRALQT